MMSNPTPEERRAQILARYNEGVTMQQIAREIGVSSQRVSQLIKIAGGKGRPNTWSWHAHATIVLNPEEMIEHLRELALSRKRITPKVVIKAGKYKPFQYVAVFGSFQAALNAAKFSESVD